MCAAFLAACLVTACTGDVGEDGARGQMGSSGDVGSAGPPGTDGEHLLWKDADGAVVPHAFVLYDNGAFVMQALCDGAFYTVLPLTGELDLAAVGPAIYFSATNCTGQTYCALPVANVGVAFQYD